MGDVTVSRATSSRSGLRLPFERVDGSVGLPSKLGCVLPDGELCLRHPDLKLGGLSLGHRAERTACRPSGRLFFSGNVTSKVFV